jgi:hypothetical protein
MRCAKCDTENRDTAKFCDKCGARLSPGCLSCGAENRPDAKFCDSCGASRSTPTGASIAETPSLETQAVAERRHLTVLLCDLVGSTALAAQVDPEEWRETVAGYQRTAAEAITRFGGFVALRRRRRAGLLRLSRGPRQRRGGGGTRESTSSSRL